MSPDSKDGRTIVVTGGADGIGRALVLLCAARGDKIAVLDKNGEAAKTTAAEAMKRGAKFALSLSCDVGSEEQVERAFHWFLSDESSYVTGSHLVCDGGILARRTLVYESVRLERR